MPFPGIFSACGSKRIPVGGRAWTRRWQVSGAKESSWDSAFVLTTILPWQLQEAQGHCVSSPWDPHPRPPKP